MNDEQGGIIDFSARFQSPWEDHFEYTVNLIGLDKSFDVFGTDYKKWKLEMSQEVFIEYSKRDVGFYSDRRQAMTTSRPPP
jgi:hypothetical protein